MIVIEKYASLEEANLLLNGGIVGGKIEPEYVGLVGATITFTAPVDACTFTQPAGRVAGVMLFKDVKEQLEAQVTDLSVVNVNDRIGFRRETDGQIVSLGAVDEPARAILGLPNETAITGRVVDGTTVKLSGPVQVAAGMVCATLEIT